MGEQESTIMSLNRDLLLEGLNHMLKHKNDDGVVSNFWRQVCIVLADGGVEWNDLIRVPSYLRRTNELNDRHHARANQFQTLQRMRSQLERERAELQQERDELERERAELAEERQALRSLYHMDFVAAARACLARRRFD